MSRLAQTFLSMSVYSLPGTALAFKGVCPNSFAVNTLAGAAAWYEPCYSMGSRCSLAADKLGVYLMSTFVRRRGRPSSALKAETRAYRAVTKAAAVPYDANRVKGQAVICWARIVASEPLIELDVQHEVWIYREQNPLPAVTLNPVDALMAHKESKSCILHSSTTLPPLPIPE